jgi:hypothetical protein
MLAWRSRTATIGDGLSDRRTNAAEQFAISVLDVLGHHRTVERKQHAIDRGCCLQAIDEFAEERLVGVARDQTSWRDPYREQRDQRERQFVGDIDEPSQNGRSVLRTSHDRRATGDPAPLDECEIDTGACERVRLVRKFGDRDAWASHGPLALERREPEQCACFTRGSRFAAEFARDADDPRD